jgi:ADP-heptose:LPS heptosyltransferase
MPPLVTVSAPSNLVTIAVGTGHPNKNYARWAEVSRLLLDRGFDVAFLGGPGESAPASAALDLVGKLSLEETMAWIAASRVHIAADTGSGHIAAACRTPVVSVFGWTKSEVYRPYTERGVVLDAGKTMDGVSPEQIVEAACAF